MKRHGLPFVGLLVITAGVACAAPPAPGVSDAPASSVASACGESATLAGCEAQVDAYGSPGFVERMELECPDGGTVRIEDTLTGEHHDAPCKDLRRFVRDDGHRDLLVNVCVATRAAYGAAEWTPRDDRGGERTCEAREPFTVFGVLCEVALSGAIAYGCSRSFGSDPTACYTGTLAAGLVVGHFACALF